MIWIAFYSDWSGMAAFDVEIDALRYAIDNGMNVFPAEFGKDLRKQAEASRRVG